MTAADRTGNWWDWRLHGRWMAVNVAAFVVVPVAGVVLEQLASSATRGLVHTHRLVAILVIAALGGGLQGALVGSWQWGVLRRRIPALRRRRWVIGTLSAALIVWLLVFAPRAVDTLAKGGSTLHVFRNLFIQALVLGPLVGISQALALRGVTSRWAWWLVANVTTYLIGAALHQFGVWLQHELSLPARTPGFFPLAAFAIHGAWMLWITAPQATIRRDSGSAKNTAAHVRLDALSWRSRSPSKRW